MAKQLTLAELREYAAALEAENETLRQSKPKAGVLSLRVSEKRGVSLYGMGRFPVTMYPRQWQKLAGAIEEVLAFIDLHKDELSWDKQPSKGVVEAKPRETKPIVQTTTQASKPSPVTEYSKAEIDTALAILRAAKVA